MIDLMIGHGHEAPVPLPRAVVCGLDQLDLLVEVLHVDLAHAQALVFYGLVRHPEQLLGRLGQPLLDLREPRVEVHGLHVTGRFDEAGVVAGIVRHHHHGRRVESVDEHAGLVVQGEVQRPTDRVHALQAVPVLGRGQQGRRHILIVDAFEEAPAAGQFFVNQVVPVVHHRADGAHQLAAAPRGEQLVARVFIQRILRRVEIGQALLDQRRHPVRVVAMELERELDVFGHATARRNRLNDDVAHGCPLTRPVPSDRIGDACAARAQPSGPAPRTARRPGPLPPWRSRPSRGRG